MPKKPAKAHSRFVVITGLSGSGKTTALKALEDLGFYAVDNLPARLLTAFVNLPLGDQDHPFMVALGMDVRAQDFIEKFPAIYRELIGKGFTMELLFLEAAQDVLLDRYSQTRRDHPLVLAGEDLAAGIERERELTAPIRSLAGQVLDTSLYNIHELKRTVQKLYADQAPSDKISLNLMSFGFKHGPPREADLVMDVRFLANPYFDEELRPLDGCDPRVVDFIFSREATRQFLERFGGLLDFLLPLYEEEGKSRLTIALGCTGGRHRSVALVEWLAGRLSAQGRKVSKRHRDLELG